MAMFVLNYVKKTTKVAIYAVLTTKINRRNICWKMASYSEVMDYLWRLHATYELLAESDADGTHYHQPDRMSLPVYVYDFWNDALRFRTLFGRFLKEVFIKVLNEKIIQRSKNFWERNAQADRKYLARHSKPKSSIRVWMRDLPDNSEKHDEKPSWRKLISGNVHGIYLKCTSSNGFRYWMSGGRMKTFSWCNLQCRITRWFMGEVIRLRSTKAKVVN